MANDEIRPYLRAVEEIDWTKVQTQSNTEHYADWFYVDGKVLLYGGGLEDGVIEFMKRAPAVIRQLLAERGDADRVQALEERVTALEQAADSRGDYEREMRERDDG